MVDVELLRLSPALRTAPERALAALARLGREVTYQAGQRIVPMIDPPKRLTLIVEGLAKLVGLSEDGKEVIIYVFRPGGLIGSQGLFDSTTISEYEVVAMTQVRSVQFGERDLLNIGRRHPELLIDMARVLTERLEHMNDRLMGCMSQDVKSRLSLLLLDFAEADSWYGGKLVPLNHSLTHETMAQIVGASRPHTSMVLKELEEMGAIRRKSDRGLLVSPRGLTEIVSRANLDRLRGLKGEPMPRPRSTLMRE